MSKFVVGRTQFGRDGFAKGLSTVDFIETQDAVLSTAKNISNIRSNGRSKHNVSGMELFQSPQSMVNSDINKFQNGNNRVLNPFLPFMSIEGFTVSDELQNLEWLSTTSGTLTLKLFDRSRIPDIAKIIGRDYLAGVFLVIEFGWSHPDGSIISNNPFGQFLDSLKRRELFIITDSRISINDDGTAGITLNITSLGHDVLNQSSMSQKFISKEKLNTYLLSLEKKLKETAAKENKASLRTTIKLDTKVPMYFNRFETNNLIYLSALEKMPSSSGNNSGFFTRYEEIMKSNDNFDDLNKKITEFVTDLKSVIEHIPYEEKNNSTSTESVLELDRSAIDSHVALIFNPLLNINDMNSIIMPLVKLKAPDTQIVNVLIAKGYTDKDITPKLRELGWTNKRLSDTYSQLGITGTAAHKEYRNEQQQTVYSTTAGVIDELLQFLSYSDGVILNAMNIRYGSADQDISTVNREISNDTSSNDTSTVLSRLSLLSKKSFDEIFNNSLEYKLLLDVSSNSQTDQTSLLKNSTIVNKYVSLGRLIGYEYGIPSTLERSHDEVQMFFHPANHHAGAFNNISLGDVFIDAQKYLNGVAKLVQSRKSSDITPNDRINIIRRILSSSDYEIGYGVSFYQSPLDKGEKDKELLLEDAKNREDYNTELNSKLAKIYNENIGEDVKTLLFKTIDLKIREETVPYMENNILKKIKRIHVFDGNSEVFYNEKELLNSLNNTSIKTILGASNYPGIKSAYDNSIKSIKEFTRKNFKKSGKEENLLHSEINSNGSQIDKITNKIAEEIEKIIKATVPTLEMGAENGFVQTISLSNDNGGLANELNLVDYVTNLGNPQNDDKSRKRDGLLLIPSSVTVNMFGFPIVSIGQTFYVTAKTNTTLDNIYKVTGISHSVAEGSFLTTITLETTMDASYQPANISSKIIDIANFSNGQPKNLSIL